MPSRNRIRLTDDEVDALLEWHRIRAVELLTWAPVTPAARRLADVAMIHHEARIGLFIAVQERRSRVTVEG
jgi:hypothetical protein